MRPLVVVGALREPISLPEGVPVLAEPISQCRVPGTISAYEALLRAPGWADAHPPGEVYRAGAAPTSRVLNEWLARLDVPHHVVDPDGLRRDPDGLATDFIAELPTGLGADAAWTEAWREADRRAGDALDLVLREELHEGSAIRALARMLRPPANVFLGSSLPVRDADWFWPASDGLRFYGNRGASGIDGLVSTGLGIAAASSDPTLLVLGDLSLYHDMNGLWAIRRHAITARLVVLDNGGGGIFEFLPPSRHRDVFEEVFATPLDLDLRHVAELYGIPYRLVETVAALEEALAATRTGMIHVRFSREASVAGHRRAWDAVASALG